MYGVYLDWFPNSGRELQLKHDIPSIKHHHLSDIKRVEVHFYLFILENFGVYCGTGSNLFCINAKEVILRK